jgi:general secretion pathway protein G
MRSGSRGASSGFTLLELMVVMAIIGILAAMAMPMLKDMPRRAQEAVLKTDLQTMRQVIDMHKGDKGRYPASLEALVEAGYLRRVPRDPITKSSETWVFEFEEEEEGAAESDAAEGSEPGIIDVHSGSDRLSLNGTPYSEW